MQRLSPRRTSTTTRIQIIGALATRLQDSGFSLAAELRASDEPVFTPPGWNIDAALLFVVSNPADLGDVEQSGIPYVAFNGECGLNGSSVQFDDAAGMRLAMRALIDRGHRRIAYVSNSNPGYRHRSVDLRASAYLRAMATLGEAPLPGHGAGAYELPRIEEQLAGLLREHRPSAIVTDQPGDAVVVYRVASRLGLSIPCYLSVITFNETDLGRDVLRPALSAVARPVVPTAHALAEHLLERLHQPGASPRSTKLRPALIERGSIAPLSSD